MIISKLIKEAVLEALGSLFGQQFDGNAFQVSQTKPEFEGDYTVVLFSLLKSAKRSPEQLGNELGTYLVNNYPQYFHSYNIIKAFLNLVISDDYWLTVLQNQYANPNFGKTVNKGRKVMVEYSSPNTNKPLHLGHLRNIFLGWSMAEIYKANGHDIIKTCVVNDRGIHICKSMIAWQLFSHGATPETSHKKGDHFVGDYYVKFNDAYKVEVEKLVSNSMPREQAEKESPLMRATQEMLLKWEQGDEKVLELWKTMNGWVYAGFAETYQRIGSDFDKIYYESETYLLGKEYVDKGLEKGVFVKKADGSVWIDLTQEGLDEKLVLRKDGTSVYITQDIGLAQLKYNDFSIDESILVIGDEQNYHVKVLKLICQKLGMPYADNMFHLSYGMVELTTGKMKSREGTVVDADDLVDEMIQEAKDKTLESGKAKDFNTEELIALYEMIGIGAMKFYLLRVDPKKKMIFNPQESIDLHGFTATSIQYTHARIKSILRTAQATGFNIGPDPLFALEKKLLIMLELYPAMIEQAGEEMNPAVIALYAYELSRKFNSFYDAHSVLKAENDQKKELRLRIAQMTANIIASSMKLLGIDVPERM
ncbi:MAG: arginine--tRNA ligase [Chitinophagaceae bacterium]